VNEYIFQGNPIKSEYRRQKLCRMRPAITADARAAHALA
jgi:hypothetical protein